MVHVISECGGLRFSPDIGRRCAGSLVRGHRGRLPAAEMLETCWTLIALLNVASICSTFWEILNQGTAQVQRSLHIAEPEIFRLPACHSADQGLVCLHFGVGSDR